MPPLRPARAPAKESCRSCRNLDCFLLFSRCTLSRLDSKVNFSADRCSPSGETTTSSVRDGHSLQLALVAETTCRACSRSTSSIGGSPHFPQDVALAATEGGNCPSPGRDRA